MIEASILSVIGLLFLLFFLLTITASWYDIRFTRQQREYTAHPYKKQFRQRPHITILLTTTNDTQATQKSIESLIKISYKKHNIIVCGARRNDFKKIPKNKSIRFVKNNPTVGSSRGELTVKIHGGMTLHPWALAPIAQHFSSQPNLGTLMLARQPLFYPSHAHLFMTYHMFVFEFFYKALSILGHMQPSLANAAVAQRKNAISSTPVTYFYADDIAVIDQPISKLSMLLKTQHNQNRRIDLRNLAYLLPFPLLSYCLYLALWQKQTALLTLITLCSTLSITVIVWWNNHLSFSQKILYTAGLPLALLYFYLFLAFKLLEVFTDMAKAVIPVGISLFVRIKNVLRIVQRF